MHKDPTQLALEALSSSLGIAGKGIEMLAQNMVEIDQRVSKLESVAGQASICTEDAKEVDNTSEAKAASSTDRKMTNLMLALSPDEVVKMKIECLRMAQASGASDREAIQIAKRYLEFIFQQQMP